MIDPARPDYANTPVSPQRPRFGYAPADIALPPCVTIVSPFYNSGSVFHKVAQSVLQQSLQQWEWLIINDGSTERESLAILENYRRGDPRIKVIDHEVHQGLSAACNTGFRAAQAPYVVQLNIDDLLEPTALEKWGWYFESYPEFAFVRGYTVGFGARECLWEHGCHSDRASIAANWINSTIMVRKSVYQAVGGYEEADHVEHLAREFWLRCAGCGYWGGTIPEYLGWYRLRQHAPRLDADAGERQRAYKARLKEQYAWLWQGEFSNLASHRYMPYDTVPDVLPWDNCLQKGKQRLLLIVPWLQMGGADKFNLDLLEQLCQRDWEVTIATTLKGDHSWLPLFTRYTPDIFILDNFLRLADYPRFLRYLIHSRRPEVVFISHSEFGYLLLPYLRAHFPEVTFVDLCHIEIEEWKNGGYPRLAIEYQELLDLNIVVSRHLKQWMVERGFDPQRSRVCYINVDADKWRPDPERRRAVRQELGMDETVPVILYAGRICAQKQPRVLARTILRLQETLDFIVLVAGDGPELEWLRVFVDKHGVSDRVRLLGAVPNERIRELLTATDLFFLPSEWEGIALAIYEAMACGVPVVGADVGGQDELVTPECGVLVTRSDEEGEVEHYARILAELLPNAQRRRAMGQAGRVRVQDFFRLEQMGERMVTLLQEAQQLHEVQPRLVPSLEVGRICALQAKTIQEQADRIEEIEAGKAWLEGQRASWQGVAENQEKLIQEQRAWIERLEQGNTWLEGQRASWQGVAENQEKLIQEQRAWIERLEQGNTWLEGQRASWQGVAENQEKLIQEQRAWIASLKRGKAWIPQSLRQIVKHLVMRRLADD
jgi:glycosyltransferase involved in cell wall biosynthesis/predicted NUDIX family NTP pyrophosphohydrolase